MFPRPPDDACGRKDRSEREVRAEFHSATARLWRSLCALCYDSGRLGLCSALGRQLVRRVGGAVERVVRGPARPRPRRPAPLRPRPRRRPRSRPPQPRLVPRLPPRRARRLGLGLGCSDRVELLLGRQLAALGDDGDPQRGGHVREELDRDLVAADPLDRLGQVDLAPVDRIFARLPDSSAMSVGVTEPKSVPVGPAWTSKRSSAASSRCAISCACSKLCASCRARLLLALAQLGDLRRRRGLRELARQQVVARVAARDVDDLAAQAELLDVLEQDDFHAQPVDVGEQRHLARPLDRDRDLPLVAAARAGDAPRADLALLGDVAPELVDVLVVDLLDLLAAEVAVALAGSGRRARACGPCAAVCCSRCGIRTGCRRRLPSRPKSALSACGAAAARTAAAPPPPSPSWRPPRNWTLSAMISTAWRLVPSWASHSRQSRRPSTATGRPLARYCAQLSPWLPQTVTSK